MSLLEKSDNEIIEIANPIWANLVKSSNMKDWWLHQRFFISNAIWSERS